MARNYTTVKEMTDQVNNLLTILQEAQKMAKNLQMQNMVNHVALVMAAPYAMVEKRPLTLEQRKTEAVKYEMMFEGAYENLTSIINEILNNY